MWHGARPSFTTIERMINTLTLTFRNRSASTEEKKNHNDATAWVKKYLTLFSSWNRDPLAVKIGKKAIIFNSSLTQILNQLFLRMANPSLIKSIK